MESAASVVRPVILSRLFKHARLEEMVGPTCQPDTGVLATPTGHYCTMYLCTCFGAVRNMSSCSVELRPHSDPGH